MLKAELLDLCKMHKPAPVYRVDHVLKSAGHTSIRLPPYHADLKPIEGIQADLKGYVGRRNLHFRKTSVETLIEEGIENIGEREWSACCKHGREIEQEYWKRDIEVEEDVDRVIVFVDSDSDVSNSEGTDTANQPIRLMRPNCFYIRILKFGNCEIRECINKYKMQGKRK